MMDNYKLWEFTEVERERWLTTRPKCSYCKDPIQDERLMVIEGELYHMSCAERLFGDNTEDYIY